MIEKKTPSAPLPREAVRNPELTRPDRVTGIARDPALLWLDKNENIDPELMRLTHRLLGEIDPMAVCTYPEMAPLYKKLAAMAEISPKNLILSAGSDGAIRQVYEAFINPGDRVIHTAPTFAMYPVYSAMYGAKTTPLTYAASDSGPRLTADKVIQAVQEIRPRLVCLPNPDSPTGTVFNPDEMRAIVETAGLAGSVILVDEAYYPFYDQSVISWVERYPNLIVARTFAKAWGLAGLRIGYAAAAPKLCAFLHKVRPMYEVNTVAVSLVEKMLDYTSDVTASVGRLNAGKSYFLEEMRLLGFKTLRGEGNFLHVAFGAKAPGVHSALKSVVLYHQDFKEPCLAGFSRFSSTTKPLFAPIVEKIKQTVSCGPSRS